MAESLALSEEAYARSIPVVALEQEKAALRDFCTLQLRKRELTTAGETTKKCRDTIKTSKAAVLDFMTRSDIQCLVFSKDQYEAAQSDLPEGIDMIPMYVRLVRTNKDSPITPDIVDEAIDSVTDDDIEEHKGVVPAIMAKVRIEIRTYVNAVKLMHNKERNQNIYDIPDVPDQLYPILIQWHTAQEQLTALQQQNRETVSEVTASINRVKSMVSTFFERTNTLNQRVVLNDKTYRISRKVSVRHEKVGLGKLEELLSQQDRQDRQDRQDLATLKTAVRHALQNIPPVTKTDICFSLVRA
jgi:hypothetical protein